jgi:hypothetical protein
MFHAQQQPTPETSVVWRPIPGTSQELALDTKANVTLYTGARGPGKTDTQLMNFRRYVGIGYGPFWRGVLFDKEYKNLDDIVTKSKRWFRAFDDGARFLESASSYKWVWPTGEELLFRTAKTEDDYWDYHGQEFPWIGWNELTKWQNLDLFTTMLSVNRSSFTPEKDNPALPPIPLRVFATCNPFGVGHNAVKRQFIDAAPYGEIVRTEFDVFNPATQAQQKVERTQVTIFGSWRENPYLDPVYIATLMSQTDKNKREAWEFGSWDITSGGALDDVFDRHYHVLPRFAIPESWRVDQGLDWGSSQPLSYAIFAEANGEEAVFPDGTRFAPPPGTIIQCGEVYLSEGIGTNKGLKWGAGKVAKHVKEYAEKLYQDGWIPRLPLAGPADNSIRDNRNDDDDSIEKTFEDNKVYFTLSDKSPGSRRNGLQLMRDRFEAALKGEEPALYFMQNCVASISTIPTLPRDPVKTDDVDTSAEDHCYDTVRYRVLRGNTRDATEINASFAV